MTVLNMSSQRLFVGNLPASTNEAALRNEFSSYGVVQSIDIKQKKNVYQNNDCELFAFINIQIDNNMLQQCINEFSQFKFNGNYLNVTVAKESFLEKLKREREEANNTKSKKIPDIECSTSNKDVHLPKLPVITSTSIKNDEHESSQEESSESEEEQQFEVVKSSSINKKIINDIGNVKIDDNDDYLMITKKQSIGSYENGKLIIPTMSNNIIGKTEKIDHKLKGIKESDKKRIDSLNKMKLEYNKQKMLIKSSLSKVDTKKNKIVFNESGVPMESKKLKKKLKTNKKEMKLFNENDDNESLDGYQNDFKIKKQFEGVKGQQLLELQTKYRNDKRFDIDNRFLDENDTALKAINDNNEDNEKNWQMNILENVIGKKLRFPENNEKKKIHKVMLRYDPTNNEHSRYLQPPKKKVKFIELNDNDDADDGRNIEKLNAEKDNQLASEETFFKVSKNLSETFKTQSEGFSLLSLFGKNEQSNDKLDAEDYNTKKIEKNKGKKLNKNPNPFIHDSSDSEDEKEDQNIKESNEKTQVIGGKLTKMGVFVENFFIIKNDPRIVEGSEFFKITTNEKFIENFDQLHRSLRDSIRTKIKRKMLRSMPHGTKNVSFKKRRKFVHKR